MKSFVRSPALLWAVGLAALVVAPARGDVPPGPCRVLGLWIGTYQSAVNPEVRGLASLDVTMQEQQRFAGEVALISLVAPGSCRGTVSASCEVTFIDESDMAMLLAQGEIVGDVMLLDYMVQFRDGRMDRGSLMLIGAPR